MDSDEDFENSSSSSDDFDELEHDISKQSPNTVPKLSNMWKVAIFLATVVVALSLSFFIYAHYRSSNDAVIIPIDDKFDIYGLFPKHDREAIMMANAIISNTTKNLKIVFDIANSSRTFSNTIFAIEKIEEKFGQVSGVMSLMEMLHPLESLRKESHRQIIRLQEYAVDTFGSKQIYNIINDYLSLNANSTCNDEERYYVRLLEERFRRKGYTLPDDQFAIVKNLEKEISQIQLEFDTNIAEDKSEIKVTLGGLKGCDEHFIQNLKTVVDKDNNTLFILGCDYPTYSEIMGHCEVQETRKALYFAFNSRATPGNVKVLDDLIAKRSELAKVLGFRSFSELDISSEMAANPARVHDFLYNISSVAKDKASRDFDLLKKDLPQGVTLTPEGKFYSYDIGFVTSYYKKKYFDIDNREIANYFPVEHTLKRLFEIYQKFLNLDFFLVKPVWAWHEDVQLIEVYNRVRSESEGPRGYIFIDLYPRPNKYSHAAHLGFVSALKKKYSDDFSPSTPSVAVVMTNFPKPSADRPALLKHSDVTTFFHEFGHAMHFLLGTTEQPSFAGTSVKTDFVEVISQMFEEWMLNKKVLNQVSQHYLTKLPLPEAMVDKMISLKNFNSGIGAQTQIIYSLISLKYFQASWNESTNVTQLYQQIYEEHMPQIQFESENRMVYSFGHLSGYGALYYGYLWAKIFALDLFSTIENRGLDSESVGADFVEKIMSKGGSQDPYLLLKAFLQRDPNQVAYVKSLG